MQQLHDIDGGEEELDDFFQFDLGDAEGETDAAPEEPFKVPPRLGLLAGLSTADFDAVARAAQLRQLEANMVVFRQGDTADRFYILIDGEVEVVRDGVQLATLGPGAFFGESALLVDGNRSATINTLTHAALWSVNYAAFRDIVQHQLFADEEAAAEAQSRLDEAEPDHFA